MSAIKMSLPSSTQLLRKLSRNAIQSTTVLQSLAGTSVALIQHQQCLEQKKESKLKLIDSTGTTSKTQYRFFGTRGSSGRGWYQNYRSDDKMKGGRHLRGEYYDRDTVEERQEWNQSILDIGYTRVYLDIVLEPIKRRSKELPVIPTTIDTDADATEIFDVAEPSIEIDFKKRNNTKLDVSELKGEVFRLYIDLATTIMPESTTNNFIQLLQNEYIGTKFYRFEKNVGIFGGDIIHNTGKSGMAYQPQSNDINNPSLLLDINNDPLALWHIPGTISMLVSKVNSVDSRFIICTQTADHLDGIHRAIGQLTNESLHIVQNWHTTLITRNSVPVSFDLIISQCGIVTDESNRNIDNDSIGNKVVNEATIAAA